MRVNMDVALSKMYVDDRIKKAAIDAIESGHYIKGQYLEAFERDFARFCGTGFAIGVSSGTSAILLSLMALGIGEGRA